MNEGSAPAPDGVPGDGDNPLGRPRDDLMRSPGDLESGLVFAHQLITETARYAVDASTWAFALGELLVERGLLDAEALAERRERIGAALQREMQQDGIGLFLNEMPDDKYAFGGGVEIDCPARVHLCKAACCTFRFPLSRQDIEEGTVRWDLGRPYWNRQDGNGYCTHCDTGAGFGCRIYEQRPIPCRTFDCRDDPRIWADFEARIPNPNLEAEMARRRQEDRIDWGDLGSDEGP